MTWGGLNNALTSWRVGINQRFPGRSTRSDGGYADSNHASTSQHQADADGTVDAYDMDNNLQASSTPDGSTVERQLLEALKLDFEADRRSYLWISHREIASRAIGPWRERAYGGDSPHDEHTHWQSVQALEDDGRPWKFTHTDALIKRLRGVDVTEVEQAILTVLESKEGQAAIAKAAGIGVHNQPLGRSGVTIGVQLQSTVGRIADDTTAIRAAVVPPPAE